MGGPAVELVELDEPVLAALLETAETDAEPDDVMAPVPGPPGWTPARRAVFLARHRDSRPTGSGLPVREFTFAVVVDRHVVGSLRLAVVADDPAALEVGLWLARGFRGQGVGRTMLRPAADRARERGADRLLARTTRSNPAALGALRSAGFVVPEGTDDDVEATLSLR